MRRASRFAKRGGGLRPERSWVDVSGQWVHSTGVTAAVPLIALQAPTNLSNLTADPPEDLTVLRIVGDYTTTITGTGAGYWSLALLVADVTWTPGTSISVDNDKRILWQRSYEAPITETSTWLPPGRWDSSITASVPTDATHIDIAPKVKIEAGKALYLVAYENAASAYTLATYSHSMRVLFQRSGRRSR